MDCHKMAIGFYAGINWPGGMQVMKTKPNGTGKLAHRCICSIQKKRCWFNKPRVRTKHPQCLEQLPNFVAASAHQVTARSVSKLVAKVGIGKLHGQMPAWWDVSNMIYRHILPSAIFPSLAVLPTNFPGLFFSWSWPLACRPMHFCFAVSSLKITAGLELLCDKESNSTASGSCPACDFLYLLIILLLLHLFFSVSCCLVVVGMCYIVTFFAYCFSL